MRQRPVLPLAVGLVALVVAFPLGAWASHQFGDVTDENPYHNDIDALADAGVTSGCGNGNYCPSAFVTREQMAAFMNRLGALAAGKTPVVNATKLDGLDSTAFVQGTGKISMARASADLSGVVDPAENRASLGTIEGLGTFTVGGAILGPGHDCDVTFTNTSGAALAVNTVTSAWSSLANGASIEFAGTGSRPDSVTVTFSIASVNAATVASGQIVVMFGFPGAANVVCAGSVQALVIG